MFISEAQVRSLVPLIAAKFPSFGGGQGTQGNPVSMALMTTPAQFAAGVDIAAVIREVAYLIPKEGD